MAAQAIGTSHSVTVTAESVELKPPDAPQRYVLVLRMGLRRMKEFFSTLLPDEWLAKLETEKEDAKKKLKKGQDLSEQQRKNVNNALQELLESTLTNFRSSLMKNLELRQEDTVEEKRLKMTLSQEIINWLQGINVWLSKRLSFIFDENNPTDVMMAETNKFLKELVDKIRPEGLSELFDELQAALDSDNPGDKPKEGDGNCKPKDDHENPKPKEGDEKFPISDKHSENPQCNLEDDN